MYQPRKNNKSAGSDYLINTSDKNSINGKKREMSIVNSFFFLLFLKLRYAYIIITCPCAKDKV